MNTYVYVCIHAHAYNLLLHIHIVYIKPCHASGCGLADGGVAPGSVCTWRGLMYAICRRTCMAGNKHELLPPVDACRERCRVKRHSLLWKRNLFLGETGLFWGKDLFL